MYCKIRLSITINFGDEIYEVTPLFNGHHMELYILLSTFFSRETIIR